MCVTLDGLWFDGKRAQPHGMCLRVDETGRVSFEPPLRAATGLDCVTVSPALGNTARCLHFDDGSLFETGDHAAIDALLRQRSGLRQRDALQQQVHRLERCWPAVFVSLLMLVLLSGWFVRDGVPLLARMVAFRLPPQLTNYIGRDSLDWLDRTALHDSALAADRQQQLQQLFAGLLPHDREGLHYRLLFRSGGKVGPNAFALPDATIVMTDELVQLAENDQQIAVVLLHEIGHVKERHLLRQLLQQAGLAVWLVAITGDISGASSLVVALPGVLMQAQYSRAAEEEADGYALAALPRHQFSPLAFAAIMRRIESWQTTQDAARASAPDQAAVWQYLSSHPATAARIRRFEQAAAAP